MKKVLLSFFTIMLMAACTGGQESPFSYRGLSFDMPASALIDSMLARGFVVDSAASDSGRTVVFAKQAEHYRVLVGIQGDKVQAIQENYRLSTNDSTRMLWQQLRDGFEKELGAWPDCPMLKDDHKVANFDATNGFISVILENTHTPTLTVRYLPKDKE